MIKKTEELRLQKVKNSFGKDKLFLYDFCDFESKNPKLRLFALAELKKGEMTDYHIHIGEAETYYIISGHAMYNDNGTKREIGPGTITYTPSGRGHSIKNIGDEDLIFIAHIILD